MGKWAVTRAVAEAFVRPRFRFAVQADTMFDPQAKQGPMVTGPTPEIPKKRSKSKDLVPFPEVRKRLRLFEEKYRGVQAIPVAAIVGSVDKSAQFDRTFRPRAAEQRERMRQIALAFPDGDYPPITVFRVGDAYFVRDGHIRVATAKDKGIEFIDAEITELETEEAIAPDTDLVDVIHLEQHRRLLTETGLSAIQPDATFGLSLPVGYTKVRMSIAVHGYQLLQERGEMLSREEVAGDWYDRVYRPAIDALQRAGLIEAFSRSTEADLFLWVEERRRSMFPERGDVEIEDVVREAGRAAGAKPQESPETAP